MADKISTAAARLAAANATTLATAMGGGTTTAQVATIAQIMNVLSKRQDLMHQILKLIPLSVNSGSGAVKPE